MSLPSVIQSITAVVVQQDIFFFHLKFHVNFPQNTSCTAKTAVNLCPNHTGTKWILHGSLGFKPPDQYWTTRTQLDRSSTKVNISALLSGLAQISAKQSNLLGYSAHFCIKYVEMMRCQKVEKQGNPTALHLKSYTASS